MVYKILLFILINLLFLNIFMLDVLYNFNIIAIALYKIHILLNTINNNNYYNFQNFTDIKIQNKNKVCILYCEDELNNIIHFYNKISQFKNFYKMIPIKIYKIDNNKCRILYYKESIPNKKYLIKEERFFTFESLINQNTCNWSIIDMSTNLKKNN